MNFFLGPSDQASFETVLHRVGDIAILKSRSHTPEPERQDTTLIARYGEEPLRVLLARPDDLASIKYRPIKGRAEFSCDPTFMPVVEFDRSYVSDEFIRPARLYYIPKYYDDTGQLVEKSKVFIDWAEGLLSATKGSLQKLERDYYAGSDALRMRAAGASFEGLSQS